MKKKTAKLVWESRDRYERIVAFPEYDPFLLDDDCDEWGWGFDLEQREEDALGGERWTRVDYLPQYLIVAMLKGLGVDTEPFTPMSKDADPKTAEPEDE